MQLLEHEGKGLLAAHGRLAVPRGVLVDDPTRTGEAAGLGSHVVVKAQVPSGGRGKAGGIRLVAQAEMADCVARLLASEIRGFPVRQVLVEELIRADREIYLAVALSPRARAAVLLMSGHGGVDVEQFPQRVATVAVPALLGLRNFHVRQAAQAAGLRIEETPGLIEAARAAYQVFTRVEADLVEINPLFQVPGGGLVAGDVRVVPTEGGAYRREYGEALRSVSERARKLGFDLVDLEPAGQVGLLSTGAGASMLVVDMLAEAGLKPINFCDLRSGRAQGADERIRLVLDYLRDRPNLRCLAVNFFAGVTDLSIFGRVLAETLAAYPLPVPAVVRLHGPGAEQARRQLAGVGATVVEELEDLVDAVGRVTRGRERVACGR